MPIIYRIPTRYVLYAPARVRVRSGLVRDGVRSIDLYI